MIESFIDWLGQEVRVGTTILYCAQGRRSTNMALGTVLAINDKRPEYGKPFGPLSLTDSISSVRVQPLRSARWNQWNTNGYRDKRTGEEIKHPYRGDTYCANPDTYGAYCKVTGAKLDAGRYGRCCPGDLSHSHWPLGEARRYYHPDARREPWKLAEWVERVEMLAKPVSLTVIDNITRWNGEVPDATAR